MVVFLIEIVQAFNLISTNHEPRDQTTALHGTRTTRIVSCSGRRAHHMEEAGIATTRVARSCNTIIKLIELDDKSSFMSESFILYSTLQPGEAEKTSCQF